MTSPPPDERRRRLAVLLAAATVVVFVGSILPLPAGGDPGVALAGPFGVGADKVVHAVSYAVIAGLAVWGTRPRWLRGTRSGVGPSLVVLVGVVLAVAGFGAGVEVVQSFVPGRTASGGDAVANAVGAVVGVAAVVGWWTVARRRVRGLSGRSGR